MDAEAIRSFSARRKLLLFEVAEQRYAICSSHVEQITAMAELQRPPGAPNLLVGFLNMAGELTPVICLRHLFGHPKTPLSLWSPLVVLRSSDSSDWRIALLVDKVHRVVAVNDYDVLALPEGHALNDCVEAVIRTAEDSVLVLLPDRLLLQQEGHAVAELQQLAQERLRELAGATP